MSQDDALRPLSPEELAAETGAALPDKEVMSLLDLNADLNIALDAAAPIDLGVAANANVAAPIEASVGANVLSAGSTAVARRAPGRAIDQGITGDAVAHAPQVSAIDQTGAPTRARPRPTPRPPPWTRRPPRRPARSTAPCSTWTSTSTASSTWPRPIDGAVAAQANVAAPIDASAAANVGSIDSVAAASSDQDALITQHITGDATATADQQSTIQQ